MVVVLYCNCLPGPGPRQDTGLTRQHLLSNKLRIAPRLPDDDPLGDILFLTRLGGLPPPSEDLMDVSP